MNVSEILEIKTGHELDALVAEHVMGYKPIVSSHWLPPGSPGRGTEPSYWLYQHPKHGESTIPMLTFNPSSDISTAFKVVERLRQEGWLVRVACMPDDAQWLVNGPAEPDMHVHKRWLVTATYIRGRMSSEPQEARKHILNKPTVYSEDAQEAICKVALLTKMESIYE